MLLRVHGIVGHITRPIGHQHLFIDLHIVESWLGGRSCRGIELDLDLGEVQVWEHEDSLFAEVLKLVPIVTPHFIEIRLGYLVLLNGLFLHFVHIFMERSHLRLQVGGSSCSSWPSNQSPPDQKSEKNP